MYIYNVRLVFFVTCFLFLVSCFIFFFFFLVVARNLGTYEYNRQACFFVHVHVVVDDLESCFLVGDAYAYCVARYRGMNKDTERGK